MTLGLINANPVVHAKKKRIARCDCPHHDDSVDPLEIYDYVRDIRDPEHPYSLEQLSILSEESNTVDEKLSRILIQHYSRLRPMVRHNETLCHDFPSIRGGDPSPRDNLHTNHSALQHGTVIGLCLREKLNDHFPLHFKVDIKVAPGSHANEESVNKQLNDKERVAAALESPNLRQLVDDCLYSNKL